MMSSATIGLGVWAKTDSLALGRYRANPMTAAVRVFIDFLALRQSHRVSKTSTIGYRQCLSDGVSLVAVNGVWNMSEGLAHAFGWIRLPNQCITDQFAACLVAGGRLRLTRTTLGNIGDEEGEAGVVSCPSLGCRHLHGCRRTPLAPICRTVSYMGHSMATSPKPSGRTNGVLRTLAAAHPSVPPAVQPSTRSEPHQAGAGRLMRLSRFILLLLPLSLGGCLSFSSSNPPPPNQNTTIVVPPGSTVVCSNGSPPPCQ